MTSNLGGARTARRGGPAAAAAALRSGFGRVWRFYLSAGGLVGGLCGLALFIAVWAFWIVNFGIVFGVSLGWIPALVLGVVLSAMLRPLWGPVAIAAVLILTAPAWDKTGKVQAATIKAWRQAGAGLDWTAKALDREGRRLRMVLRREGLWPFDAPRS